MGAFWPDALPAAITHMGISGVEPRFAGRRSDASATESRLLQPLYGNRLRNRCQRSSILCIPCEFGALVRQREGLPASENRVTSRLRNDLYCVEWDVKL